MNISQGSVDTLFRWDGKRLHDFEANLFRKWVYQILSGSPEFYRRYYKKRSGLFFFFNTV